MKSKRRLSVFMTVEEELIRHVVHNNLVSSLLCHDQLLQGRATKTNEKSACLQHSRSEP